MYCSTVSGYAGPPENLPGCKADRDRDLLSGIRRPPVAARTTLEHDRVSPLKTSPEFHRTNWIPSPLSTFSGDHRLKRSDDHEAHLQVKRDGHSKLNDTRDGHTDRLKSLMAEIPHGRSVLWGMMEDLGEDPLPDCIYVVGGGDAPGMSMMAHSSGEVFINGEWQPIPSMALPRMFFSAVCVDEQLFINGGNVLGGPELGEVGERKTRRGEMFDPDTRSWSHIAAMTERRMGHALVCPQVRSDAGVWKEGSQLYAVGGSDGEVVHASMEMYDMASDRWTACAPMSTARQNAAVCCVQDKIFVIGGSNGEEVVGSVECYSTTKRQWVNPRTVAISMTSSTFPSMPTPRQGAACCVLNEQIYVIGGFSGEEYVCNVDRLNWSTGTWNRCCPLPYARAGIGASVLNGTIYAAGGYDGEDRFATADCYDYIEDTWSPLPPMQVPRQGAVVAACQEPVPAVPPQTVEWQMKILQDAYNQDDMNKAASAYAPKTLVTVNGGKDFVGKTPEEVAGFFTMLHHGIGATKLKFTIQTIHDIVHEDSWTSDAGTGTCKAVWAKIGNDWKIIQDDITFVPYPIGENGEPQKPEDPTLVEEQEAESVLEGWRELNEEAAELEGN